MGSHPATDDAGEAARRPASKAKSAVSLAPGARNNEADTRGDRDPPRDPHAGVEWEAVEGGADLAGGERSLSRALAHHLQSSVDRVASSADRAFVARNLGLLTRAGVTQLLNLLLLAPDLQARVLELEAVDGAELVAERTLRAVAHVGTWVEPTTGHPSGSWRG